MNKAKFLLSAIGIVAVASAALASKIDSVVYQRTVANTTICELTVVNATLQNVAEATTTIPDTFATLEKGAECTTLTTVYLGQF